MKPRAFRAGNLFVVLAALVTLLPLLSGTGRNHAALSPTDEAELTAALQRISAGWHQPSVDVANRIMLFSGYSAVEWRDFFDGYLAENPLTEALWGYLHYPVFGWGDRNNRDRL
jgi:hypothetical protein